MPCFLCDDNGGGPGRGVHGDRASGTHGAHLDGRGGNGVDTVGRDDDGHAVRGGLGGGARQDVERRLGTHAHGTAAIVAAAVLCPAGLDRKGLCGGPRVDVGGRANGAALGDGGDLRGVCRHRARDGEDARGAAGEGQRRHRIDCRRSGGAQILRRAGTCCARR